MVKENVDLTCTEMSTGSEIGRHGEAYSGWHCGNGIAELTACDGMCWRGGDRNGQHLTTQTPNNDTRLRALLCRVYPERSNFSWKFSNFSSCLQGISKCSVYMLKFVQYVAVLPLNLVETRLLFLFLNNILFTDLL